MDGSGPNEDAGVGRPFESDLIEMLKLGLEHESAEISEDPIGEFEVLEQEQVLDESLGFPSVKQCLCNDSVPRVSLVALKEFLKTQLAGLPGNRFSTEVSAFGYFVILAVARNRSVENMTTLEPSSLLSGWTWVLSLDWIPENYREIVGRASNDLGGRS